MMTAGSITRRLAGFAALMLAAGTSPMLADGVQLATPLGVAMRHDATICGYFEGTTPPHGQITIIAMDDPQTLVRAEIAGSGAGCPQSVTPAMTAVLLKATEGDVPNNEAAIAVFGPAHLSVQRGHVTLAEQDGISFRSCTSADGVHLTAWSGKARLWHAYYDIGQDLEASCTDAESAP